MSLSCTTEFAHRVRATQNKKIIFCHIESFQLDTSENTMDFSTNIGKCLPTERYVFPQHYRSGWNTIASTALKTIAVEDDPVYAERFLWKVIQARHHFTHIVKHPPPLKPSIFYPDLGKFSVNVSYIISLGSLERHHYNQTHSFKLNPIIVHEIPILNLLR